MERKRTTEGVSNGAKSKQSNATRIIETRVSQSRQYVASFCCTFYTFTVQYSIIQYSIVQYSTVQALLRMVAMHPGTCGLGNTLARHPND
jgi:hypothetical protein